LVKACSGKAASGTARVALASLASGRRPCHHHGDRWRVLLLWRRVVRLLVHEGRRVRLLLRQWMLTIGRASSGALVQYGADTRHREEGEAQPQARKHERAGGKHARRGRHGHEPCDAEDAVEHGPTRV